MKNIPAFLILAIVIMILFLSITYALFIFSIIPYSGHLLTGVIIIEFLFDVLIIALMGLDDPDWFYIKPFKNLIK